MPEIHIRDAVPDDYPRIVELNAVALRHTSAMDTARLAELDGLSSYHRIIAVDDRVAGFLLALRESADYRNDKFGFREIGTQWLDGGKKRASLQLAKIQTA